jgi:hypothetical protein
MAVYQYLLYVIPLQSVKERFEVIPKNIFRSQDVRGENLFSSDQEYKPTFRDIRSISWWKNNPIDTSKISECLDDIMPRTFYSEPTFLSWKGNSSEKEDNDARIFANSNNEIEEFEFRVDLRDSNKFPKILESLLKICLNNDCLVIDAKGNLMKPKLKIVAESLLSSNALRFLIDPEEFLKSL